MLPLRAGLKGLPAKAKHRTPLSGKEYSAASRGVVRDIVTRQPRTFVSYKTSTASTKYPYFPPASTALAHLQGRYHSNLRTYFHQLRYRKTYILIHGVSLPHIAIPCKDGEYAPVTQGVLRPTGIEHAEEPHRLAVWLCCFAHP